MEATRLPSCLSLPKVSLLHTCPPSTIMSALERFDDIMREAVSDLAGCPLSDWSWLKVSFPSSLGGLNIQQATLHSPAALWIPFFNLNPSFATFLVDQLHTQITSLT